MIPPPQVLAGKSALVTGGAKRIGRAIAISLAAAGADVTISFRNSGADAVHTVNEIVRLGRRAQGVECDVRSESDIRDLVEEAIAFHGRLDLLVNNAAIFETAALDSLTLEQWDAVFETNARGPFLAAREALPHLRTTGGRIINIGSLGGIEAWAGHGHYCASKAALHMLTRVMAKAFAPDVSVNCVAPGWIDMGDRTPELAERFAAKTPLRRNGTAADIAEAVLFFAANASFITGQIVAVDGGLGI
jgi:3-oxoacyl-[acyl-carrier protein] reductase/pteridine reductase